MIVLFQLNGAVSFILAEVNTDVDSITLYDGTHVSSIMLNYSDQTVW